MSARAQQPFERVGAYWPTGVAILAGTDEEGAPFRITVNGCTPVSMQPPVVALAINQRSSRLKNLGRRAEFSLHLLDDRHAHWTGSPNEATLDTVPGGALAMLRCRVRKVIDAGDHRVLFADVLRAEARPGRPLVHWRRAFWRLDVRHAFLADEHTFEAFIAAWRECRLAKADWTHGAHVAACAYFAFDHDADETFALMKRGIVAFNDAVGTANTSMSGYHESLTRLWAAVVVHHLRTHPPASRWEAVGSAVERFGEDRDLHRLFYSYDVMNDERARAVWVPPDLAPGVEFPAFR